MEQKMSNALYATRDDPCDTSRTAHRAKLDVIAAAMLTGGASGGWAMARALKSQAARRADPWLDPRPRTQPATGPGRSDVIGMQEKARRERQILRRPFSAGEANLLFGL
jgi:hypothetical protein